MKSKNILERVHKAENNEKYYKGKFKEVKKENSKLRKENTELKKNLDNF